MQFYKVNDGTVLSIQEIRNENPNVGIPDNPEDLSDIGYEKYSFIAPPQIGINQQADMGAPIKNENGVWETNWIISNKAQEDVNAELFAIREIKWSEIKAERDRRTQSGVKVGTYWFHSDSASRIQQLGLKDRARDILAAGGTMTDPILILNQPVQWQTLEGTAVPLTVQLAFDIVKGIGDLDAMLFFTAKSHYNNMILASNPAAYNVLQGWPKTFGEQ